MQITEQGIAHVAPGLDDPLGLLAACHERIEGHCVTLLRLQAHMKIHGGDVIAQEAAARVHHYFAQAGRWHHEDEEVDLRPLLDEVGDSGLRNMMAALMAQHEDLDRAYAPLANALSELSPALRDLPVESFIHLTRSHIATENAYIFPRARLLLGPDHLARLSLAMARRRNVEWRGLGS